MKRGRRYHDQRSFCEWVADTIVFCVTFLGLSFIAVNLLFFAWECFNG